VPLPFLSESIRGRYRHWPLALLLVSLGLTAAAAFDAQRAVRSQRSVAGLALKDYSSFAAWSYAQHLRDTLGSIAREALGAVNHGEQLHVNPHVPSAASMSTYLPWDSTCACHRGLRGPRPDYFFAMKIGWTTLDVGPAPIGLGWPEKSPGATHNAHDMHEEAAQPEVSAAHDDATTRWIIDSLTRRIRGLGRVDHGYALVIRKIDTRSTMIAYTLMPTVWGDTIVYGAQYSPTAFARIAGGVLDAEGLLPATFTAGRRNRDIMDVRLTDVSGNRLFDSARGMRSAVGAQLELPDPFGSLALDVAIRPAIVGTLLVGGLPKSHLPFLIGLLVLAATLSLVAVMQIRRDGELAQLRADFVSSVSHELRTPVAQIRLYLDTLRLGRATTDAQREWTLDHIDRETTRLTHLVENVLRLSQLGDDAATNEPTDVASEVRRVVDDFEPLARSRRARLIVTTTGAPLARVRADALRHIVINLLDNAVKYGPLDQAVHVIVSQIAHSIEIAVEDEGPGIPLEDRERIWRPFTRGRVTHGQGGSGIGLTIVREIAVACGGSVRAESAIGGGARIVVSLPVQPVAIAHVETATVPA
jgi:signal transduction histidine kinase